MYCCYGKQQLGWAGLKTRRTPLGEEANANKEFICSFLFFFTKACFEVVFSLLVFVVDYFVWVVWIECVC